MNQRLPKALRIHQASEIRKILREGRKHIGTHFIFYCLSSDDSASPIRAGFLSPKRLGKAVQRNRLRRRMRELFRLHKAGMNGSHQLLIMGRTFAIGADFEALRDDFLRLCRKARLLPPA